MHFWDIRGLSHTLTSIECLVCKNIIMWNIKNILLLVLFYLYMTEAAIIGIAKFGGGSMVEIRQETINDRNITVMGDIIIQTDGKLEVQLINLPSGGCSDVNDVESFELLGVLAESNKVVQKSEIFLINETMEWKSNIYFPFSGAIGVFIRGCELGEAGLDCSSGYVQDCAEINWMEEIEVSASSDAEWGSWTPWSKCEATCKKYRYRGCISKSLLEGESVCSGSNKESLSCSGGSCIINNQWSCWSICGHDCTKSRFRECSNEGCSRIETESCSNGHCKIDGGWGDWAPWTPCGNNCMKYRFRGCVNPYPLNGGSYCPGKNQESSTCDGGSCRVDGK